MSWVGIVVAVLCIWLAIKAIGALFKLALWGAALLALYWFTAPYVGWPPLW